MSKIVHGIPVPLFDRLCSEPADEGAADMLETREDIQGSIHRELMRLLNTRSPLPLDLYVQSTLSVRDYGVPDFLALSASSGEDRMRLQSALQQAIEQFEPRLTNIQVQLQAAPGEAMTALLHITADARIETADRRMEFDIALEPGQDARFAT